AGSTKATEVLSGGGSVMYQGATGNVRFDANGDVSAPAVTWTFSEAGTQEASYITLEEVDAFMASVN
ncbi:MAG: ABC transporter substrate-binding protein, partial [Roseibium sp.]